MAAGRALISDFRVNGSDASPFLSCFSQRTHGPNGALRQSTGRVCISPPPQPQQL